MLQILMVFLGVFGFLVVLTIVLDALLYQDEQQF